MVVVWCLVFGWMVLRLVVLVAYRDSMEECKTVKGRGTYLERGKLVRGRCGVIVEQ